MVSVPDVNAAFFPPPPPSRALRNKNNQSSGSGGRRRRRKLPSEARLRLPRPGSGPGPRRSSHGSPPEHLGRPDRRRGRAGLRALHRPELLVPAAGLVSSGGVQLHHRGGTAATPPSTLFHSILLYFTLFYRKLHRVSAREPTWILMMMVMVRR